MRRLYLSPRLFASLLTQTLVVTVVLLFTLLFLSSEATSGIPEETKLGIKGGSLDTGGDSPLTTCFTWSGHGGVVVESIRLDDEPPVVGEFVVEDIPLGASIIQAYFLSTGWHDDEHSASALFNAITLPTIMPTATDPGGSTFYVLSYYRWDVAAIVNGNGTYSFQCLDLIQCYMAGLVIVYEDPASPEVQIVINDGAESLIEASSTTNFVGFGETEGVLMVLAQAGDESAGGGEAIEFNGEVLSGPGNIFVSNPGVVPDYFGFMVDNIQVDNDLTITTGDDWIGIHLAILVAGQGLADINLVLTPFSSPIIIPASGGSFDFSAVATNSGTYRLQFGAWIESIDPLGITSDPLMGPTTIYLDPGTTRWFRTQNIPGSAMAGDYDYVGNIGKYPDEVLSSSNFAFEKLQTGDGPKVGDWNNWGDEFGATLETSKPFVLNNFAITSNYPNPFNPSTVLSYKLQAASTVNLAVYDIAGKQVAELVDGWRKAGSHEVTFDGSGLSSGVYIYHLTAGEFVGVGKMVLLK